MSQTTVSVQVCMPVYATVHSLNEVNMAHAPEYAIGRIICKKMHVMVVVLVIVVVMSMSAIDQPYS